jgi:hypothetical protein
VIHDVLKLSQIGVKPIELSPMPKICDEGDCHGLTCHLTYNEVAADVADDEVLTWRAQGR